MVEWLVANKGQTACGGGFLTDGEKAWPVHSAKKNSESRELEEEPQLDQSKELVRTMDAGGSNVADDEDSEGDLDRCSPSMTAERPGVTRAQYLGDGPSPVFEQVFTGDRESNGKLGTESSMSWTPAQEFVAHQSGVNSLHVKSFAGKGVRRLVICSNNNNNNNRIFFFFSFAGKGVRRLVICSNNNNNNNRIFFFSPFSSFPCKTASISRPICLQLFRLTLII